MRIAIFEDEAISREQLKRSLQRLRPDCEVDFESDSLADAIEYFNNSPTIDLAFMDIELADGNCFDIFDRTNVNVPIIFTTAYSEFALQAFKTDSVDYLLKPIADADLLMALNKFQLRQRQVAVTAPMMPKRLLCNSGDNYFSIPAEQIAWLQSEDKYVVAITNDGDRRLAVSNNLSAISKQLVDNDFFQLSRNYTVAIRAIAKVSKYFRGRLSVTLRAGSVSERVTVSALRREQFLRWYGNLS
ncbi:MAG: LytTR family DNA-binding domain-containing protein [Bacteroidales bacterium]|nr:LytTR family DNA-binding domain-containing protein [Bacteroidales bacterium]